MTENIFEDLVQEALDHDFSGWDFSWTRGRWHENDPSWNYRQLVEEKAGGAQTLLDMGTGGGEFLASLKNRPAQTFATESYPPNIPIAQQRLEPLGVQVFAFQDDKDLPISSNIMELVINRHESYDVSEIKRIMKPGATFFTQQVGPLDCIQINEFLDAPLDPDIKTWCLEKEIAPLEAQGFRILRAEEEYPDSIFDDIGVIVFYLKVIEWQIPDFSIEQYQERLRAMHRHISEYGPFQAKSHRYLIEAVRR